MTRKLIFDYDKIKEYDDMFQRWKEELFPNEIYKYKNGCCCAFAHLLADKAKQEGLDPLKIWCLQSESSPEEREQMKKDYPNLKENDYPIYATVQKEDGTGVAKRVWGGYHVAMCLDLPVYKNSVKHERIVFDPTLFSSPVRESDWNRVLSSQITEYSRFGAPYRGCENGYWLDDVAPGVDLNELADFQICSIKGEEPIKPFDSSMLRLAAIDKRNNPELFVENANANKNTQTRKKYYGR